MPQYTHRHQHHIDRPQHKYTYMHTRPKRSTINSCYAGKPQVTVLQLSCNTFIVYIMWLVGLIVRFRYGVSVMILLRISIFSKVITETSYPKLTIKPHKLYYKYNLLAFTVE